MQHFAIVAPNALATAQFLGIPALCCAFAVFAHFKFAKTMQLLLVKVVLLLVAGFQLRTFYYACHSEVQFGGDRMTFKVPGYYDRVVNLRDVAFEHIRVVDLDQTPDLQPKHRTNGIGLWGYALGWHRLNDGHNAWVAITDRKRVVMIPEYEGPTVLVSVDDPAAFIAYLLSLIDTSESAFETEGG